MLKRRFWLVAVLAGFASSAMGLRAATALEVHLYPLTGDVRLANPGPTDYPFVYYELKSDGHAFTGLPGSWTSIADNYDVSGNGLVDPVNSWLELATSSNQVAEALFSGSTSALPAYRSIGLGTIWNPEAILPNDVVATIVNGSSQTLSIPVVISLVGDYNGDLSVDSADYGQWRTALGSTTSPHADGNFDGIVDAADYTIWRDHFGLDISQAGYGNVGGNGSLNVVAPAVPEPAAILVALTAAIGLLPTVRRRRG